MRVAIVGSANFVCIFPFLELLICDLKLLIDFLILLLNRSELLTRIPSTYILSLARSSDLIHGDKLLLLLQKHHLVLHHKDLIMDLILRECWIL